MPELQVVRADHAAALLSFEQENRAYFAAVVPDRGDDYFAEFDQRHAELLARQADGQDFCHVLVAADGAIVGRVNLFEVTDGCAELGFRIAERVAGKGVATTAVRQVCALAAAQYGLTALRARAKVANLGSTKILTRTGFLPTGEIVLNGSPAITYLLELA